jgi:hypothetical protein
MVWSKIERRQTEEEKPIFMVKGNRKTEGHYGRQTKRDRETKRQRDRKTNDFMVMGCINKIFR